MEGLRVNPIC